MGALVYLATAAVLAAFAFVVHRLYLHPLAAVPGPKLAALTSWYEFYYESLCQGGGKIPFKVDELHAIYGPVVRINPWEVHINDPVYWDALFTSAKLDKDRWYARPFGSHGSITATAPEALHRRRRAAIANYFSMTNVRRFEPFVLSLIQKLCYRLEQYRDQDKPANLSNAFRSLATDAVTSFALPTRDHLLDSPDFAKTFHLNTRAFAKFLGIDRHLKVVLNMVKSLPDWAIIAMDSSGGGQAIVKYMSIYKRNAKLAVDRNGKPPGDAVPSIMDVIAASPQLADEDKSLTRILEEGQNIVGAGTETTGVVLSVVTYYALADREILRKLQAELRGASATPKEWLSVRTIEQLPYLQACINESLRISCPVSGRFPRVNLHDPMSYRDPKSQRIYTFPPGTVMSMSMRHMHLDPDAFPEPTKFKPERWLDSSAEAKAKMQQYFVPFSKGSRNCIGMDLARMVLPLTAANLFNQLDLELYETTERDITLAHDFFAPFAAFDSEGVQVRVL